MYYTMMESPIGRLLIRGDGETISGVHMDGEHALKKFDGDARNDKLFAAAVEQLRAYFAGELTEFDLPLRPRGTAFQQNVWQALRSIPYGETVSYRDIAEKIKAPTAVRAVGAANGKNPIGIVVPCHRVIGANGTLTGYAGGLERKQWLLAHENAHKADTFQLTAP